jgi:hypothetical protein
MPAGYASPVRPLAFLGILSLFPGAARAQASVASDLWRVAMGTLSVPVALADGGTAPVWTPAVDLPPQARARFGIETIQSPSEVGVSGGLAAVTARVAGLGILSVTYGRLSIGDVAYTETSPEAIGDVPIYNQSFSVGVSGPVSHGVTGGVALRYLSGALGFASREQFGLDLGVVYRAPFVRLGVATRFFDPHFGASAQAASYNVGAEVHSRPFAAWGTSAVVLARYGVTAERGEAAQQLFSAGLSLGGTLALDVGAASESTAGTGIWRTRLGLGLGSGSFRFQIGRDGGVNGFGATYRLGLTADLR